MYARALTTRQISEQIEDTYGFECSESFIFIDATHFSVREDNRIKKIAAYVVFGITKDGMKEVLSLEIGENESSKY